MGVGCGFLNWASVALEVFGLVLVAWQLTRIQRRELGTPSWVLRFLAWWPPWKRSRSVEIAVPAATARAEGSPVTLRWGEAPDDTLDSRVDVLERQVAALDRAAVERDAAVNQRVSAMSTRVDQLRADVDREMARRDEEHREQLREDVTLQWVGTGLFFLGAVLNGVFNSTC